MFYLQVDRPILFPPRTAPEHDPEKRNGVFTNGLPKVLAKFENMLKKNNDGDGYFVGTSVRNRPFPKIIIVKFLPSLLLSPLASGLCLPLRQSNAAYVGITRACELFYVAVLENNFVHRS